MALLSYDLSLDQSADSSSYTWTLYTPNKAGLVDLTSATARMMIRNMPSDPAPLVSITNSLTSSGQLVLGGVLGTIGLTITKVATALLVAQTPGSLTSKYIYDVFVDFPNGTSTAIVAGNVNVRIAITH